MSRSASEWTGDLPFRIRVQSLRFRCAGNPAPGKVPGAKFDRLFRYRYRRQFFRPSDDDSKTTDSCNSVRGLTLPIKVGPGRMTPKTALIQGLASSVSEAMPAASIWAPVAPLLAPLHRAAASAAGALRHHHTGPMPGHRIDKTVAGVGMALSARFQHMAQQEQSRQPEAVLQVLIRPAVRAAAAGAQERWQPQQPVAPGIAGLPRHRAAGFRRDINQLSGLAGRGAGFQIEAEAEL